MTSPDPTPFPLHALAPEARDEALEKDLLGTVPELRQLIVASSNEQQEVLEFRERYDRLPESTPLAPRSLQSIREGRSTYLNLQARLIILAKHYEDLVGLDADALARLRVDPVLRERAVLVSFVAALTLYDNYLSVRTVMEDDRLRRLIEHPTRGYGRKATEVREVLEDLNSPRRQGRLRALVQAYDRFSDHLEARHDAVIDQLQDAVESNAAYRYARDATLAQRLPSTTERVRERILDALDGLGKSTLGTLSEVFGNGIGLVEVRKGLLWEKEAVEQHLRGILQPLDLLLEKTPFRLTDKFIPGHFGHVALWVGTAAELEAMGIFSDPLFEDPRFRGCEAQVRQGRSVLEALRTGVQLSSLAEFLNVDDLAVLRPVGLSEAEQHASLLRAFRQVGKSYDFNFEVETIEKITCSELPYHVFPDIPWETEAQFGQHTISPDQVAAQATGKEAPLRLVELWHEGRRIESDRQEALLDDLLREGAS